ncbi:right-handed parallel beta-helix repeat-containing protein [Candidatus Woesearchaeota archaeon]|nr:right-handed parallel beta-helix repeat-containing protein [Candidatus Woesearchaeota archaeon]
MSFSCPGGQSCVANLTAGTATLDWAKSKTGTVTWNILACSGSSSSSPYNITWNETSTTGQQITWNTSLITVAAPPDTTLPSVLQQYPANNSINNTGTVNFNCSATDNTNLKNISLWGNFTGTWALNDSWCNVTGTAASCQWNKTLPSNTYIWGCRAFDLANNSNWTMQNWTLIVDTLSPTFSNALNSSGWQYDNVTMNITISNNAVDGYIFSTNITGTWANDSWVDITSNPTTYNANTTKNISLAAGVGYGWKYYANDTAKNIGESITYNATVKTDIMPNISLISPSDGTSSVLTNFTFKAAGTDDRALVNATFYWNYSGTWLSNGTVTMSGTSAQANFTRDNLAFGSYIWNVQFCDSIGQCNFSLTNYSLTLRAANVYCAGNYTEGSDWIVSRNITCANETIYMTNNITILNNGSLYLYNVTLNFSMFTDGSNFINKSPNGGLFIYDLDSNASTQEDGSWIMSNDSNFEFDFWAFGNGLNDNFTMRNSKVSDAGYSTNSQGIQLYNVSNVVVSGNNVSGGVQYGVYLQYSTNNNISSNNINITGTGSDSSNIYLLSSSNSNTLSSNTITTDGNTNNYGIYLKSSSNSNNVSGNTITTKGSSGVGIYLLSSSNSNTLTNNEITTNGSNGIGIIIGLGSGSNTLSSNTITTNGSSGYGIEIGDSGNTNITGNTITTSNTNGWGIHLLSNAQSNTLTSNTITTNGSTGYGIYLNSNLASQILISNTITTSGSSGVGIYLLSSSNNNATNNVINATGTNADGVYIFADSDNNILNLNNISKSGRDGIRIENSGTSLPERNNITNNIILNATGNGIFINNTLTASQFIYNNNISYSSNNSIQLNNASNITIIAGSLEYSRVGINASQSLNVTIANATFVLSTLWDFYIMNNSWLISLNNSFNSTAVNITGSAGDFSNFTVMWYARANVTNSSGIHMNSSSVTSTDVFGASEWTDTTTNGLTGWFAVIDYVQNASSINSSNLHTGTASLTGYLANSSTYNISVKNITGTQVDIVLKNQRKFCNNSYIEGQATWNITSNITCTNETIYVAGNITVYNNGSLTLYNVTINFSAFADGSNFINKSPNGGLYIYDLDSNASTQEDGSWLMSNDSNYEYDFWAFGNGGNDNFTMRNSKITDAGYSTNSQGIQLYNISNAVVLGNNISEGAQYGLYLQYSTNNNISSNTITTSGSSGYGIYLASSSNSNTLSSNIITTNGSNGYGIYIESSNNPNISNNNVNTKGNSGYGIWLYSIVVNDINSGVLTSNIITTNGTSGYGIFVQRSINLTSTSNTITTSGGSGYGIRIDSSSNNNATSNTINATGTNADGIYIFSTSRSNTINFNNISKSGRDGIRIENSGTSLPERNNITNNIILNSTGNGIFLNNTLTASQFIYSNNISYSSNNSIQLNNASNITIIAGSLEYSRTGINASQSVNVTITNATFVLNTLWDFYITNNSWITSLNNSFNKTAVNVTNSGDYSNFTVQWYARANVTNSSGIHMNSSSVTSTDVYSASEWTDTTTNGLTGWFAVIDYVQNGTTIVDYNLHTAAASLTSYVANSSTYNVSVKNITGTQVDIVLKNPRALCNGNYTELQVSWNITSNVTCANETIPVYGNITIFSNGSLTLRNVTLIFQASSDGYNFINKSPNGGLFIYDLDNNASTQEDATEINTTNSDYEFDFWVYGNGGSDNFTMQNSILKDAGYSSVSQGIYLYNISNVKVIGNNISDGALYGLWLRFSSNNNVTSNTITTSNTNGYGIYLRSSSNNNISSNTITTNGSSGFGIYLYTSSSSNTIQSNTITTIKGSGYGINLDGITGSNSNNNVTGNIITTNGSSGYGIYLLVNANLNTIQGNTITTNGSLGYGILLSSNSYSILQGNIITVNNATGIYFSVSSNNNATGNMINATGANADGIYIFSNSDNNIFNLNNISKSGRDGIRIENSGTSLPERNNITNNIILNATGNGIFLNNTKTASQLLFNNNITYSGINYAAVKLINASNITIIGGIIENNTIGINATKSINVTIANATFIGSALWDFYATDNAWITSLNNSFNHSSVNVTRTYTADLTFSGISKPTRSHNATYGSSTMLPPVNLVNGTEFASAQYSGIVNSDDSIFNYSTTRYSYHKFSFRINRSLDKTRIENLTVLWEGKASNATRSLNASLYIWNSTQWETAANTTGDGSSDENLTKGYANATAYIDAYNMLHLLAIAQSNASSNISTDYVRVSVLLIDASNFTVQWYVDVNVTGSDSNAIAGATVFAYENSSGSWSQRWADVTADSGFTGKWAVIEYVQNATSFVNYTSNFTANVSTRENSTIKYIASSQQVDVRIPVQNGSLRLTSPANETKLDRDAANTSVADFDILTAVLSDSGANVNITFYANLTNPNISGQTMVVLGSNLTNSSGYATLIFNPGSSLYAGNYTWWSIAGSIGSYNGSETRTLLIYGGLNATFRNSTSTPNATYSPGEEVIIEALLNSLGGPETAAQINSSYLANVSAYLMQPNGTAIRVQMIDPAAAVGNTTSPFSCGNNCKSCREAGNGTIDSCYDGSSCTVVYVNNITAVDLTDNEFSTGDTVQVNISVYNCFGPGNHEVAIAYNNGSGWVNKYNGATNNGACTLENNHTATFTLDDVSGTHNIRGIIAYTGATNMTCGSDADAVGSDTDDINITVNAKNYWNGSYVLPSTALSGQWNVTLNSSANWFFGNSSGDRNFTVAGDYVAPIVTLNSPINYYNETSTSTITFNCSATDNVNLTNITLYGNWSGWHANETKYVAGTSNSATFTKNLTNGTYTWNCLAFDNYSNSAFASANFTLSVFPKTYCNGNYTDGTDWIVNKNVTCANETIYVTGNITILNNASLYLYNATLIFESFADGSNFINKSPNGGLFIYDLDSNASTQEDATEINTTNSDFEFDFWVYGNGGNDNFTLQNSIVREAGYSGGSLGIRLYNVSNVVISGNNVSSGAYYSLYLRYSTNNNITNNTVTTSGGTGIGIYLLSSSNSNTLQSNTITTNGSSGYGIFLSSSSNSNTLQGNTITTAGSDGYGIYLDISSNSNITNNTITTNGGSSYGIWLDIISNSNKLQSNTITTNGGSSWGIYFSSSSSSNTLQSNTITTNGTNSHGIYLLTSSNNNATSNIINATGTNADGVYVFSNSDNNIFNLNNISKSGRDGIRIEGSTNERNNITNNIILNSTGSGIFLNNTKTAFQFIYNNNISYSSNSSIQLNNASNITIISGSLEYSRTGINASQSVNVTIANATFVLSALWDFYITNNSWITSLNNTFNKSAVNITNAAGDYSNFTNQYYVDVNVTGSDSNAVSGATVFAYENSSGSWSQRWADVTADSGFTGKWAVTEYFQNATNIINYTSNFTANYTTRENSTIKYIASSQQADVRIPVQIGTLFLISPANETKLDRDAVNASVADSDILIANITSSTANVNITFYANLTNPSISGQTMVVLGSNLTNSSGYATLIFNPNSSIYAGNYTWWAASGSYNGSETRTLLIYGGLNTTFRNNATTPNATYSPGEEVIIEALLNSSGVENATQLNSTYLANVSAYLMQPNGTTIRVQLTASVAAVGGTSSATGYPVRVMYNNVTTDGGTHLGGIENSDGSYGVKYKLGSWSAAATGIGFRNSVNSDWINETITYSWIEINATGTAVTLSDDSVSSTINMPFNISFLNGTRYDKLRISSNGYIYFNTNESSAGCCDGVDIPNPALPNNYVAGYWEDLNPAIGGKIYYKTAGSAPTRAFIVEFDGVYHYSGDSSTTVTFQIVFNETDQVNSTANITNASIWNGSYVLPSTALAGQWNVTLNSSADWFFGNSSGGRNFTVSDTTLPVVTLNSPINYYNETSTNTITFNCSATDNVNLKKITLYGN